MGGITPTLKKSRLIQSLELGVVTIVDGCQDEEADSVAQGTPCQHIYDGEASGVVGLQKAGHLLSTAVTGVEVSHSVLHGQSLPRDLHRRRPQIQRAGSPQSTHREDVVNNCI